MPGAATGGEDGESPSAGSGPNVQVVERDGVRQFTASTSVASRPPGGFGNSLPFMPQSILAIGNGYRVRFANSISANAGPARWVRYDYAKTERLSGSGNYRAEAHATLIQGDRYEDQQVFNYSTGHSCAGVARVNRTAKTCSSPSFRTSPGEKWFVISGHSFDHGNDGSVEKQIIGELDWVWTASSR